MGEVQGHAQGLRLSVGSGGGGRVDMMVVGIGACAGTEDGKCGVGLRRLSR